MGTNFVFQTIFIIFILFQFRWTRVSGAGTWPNSSQKFGLNETSTGASTVHLDRFSPKTSKVYPNGPVQRSGIGIEKGPPDIQFGLSFTIPFVSLSTEKLLSQVASHRGYDSLWDLANALKLNVGGLVVAAVVGVAALLFLPAFFPGKFGSLFNGGFGSGGGGGWSGNGFGGFFPGFLEQLVPGFSLNKPLGYGQTYDPSTYTYNKNEPYYGPYSERKEQDGKSRALKEDPTLQNQTGNFWSQVFREVRNTAKEFETCALYAMCERGRNFTTELKLTNKGSHSKLPGRSGRTDDKGSHGGDVKKEQLQETPTSTYEHIFEVVREIGGDEIPGLGHMQKAFENGKNGQDCTKYYKKCPLSTIPLGQMVQNVGDYIFT